MLKAQQIALAVLIHAAFISSTYASEQSEAKGFVEDAEGSVLFRTGYLTRDKKHGRDDTSSFAQTAMVKLESGFTQGPVGLGAGVIGDASFKIGENAHTGNGMMPQHPNGDAYDHWARGGAFVKARVSNTTAVYGTQILDLPVLASNTARLVPEYFTGLLVTSNEIDKMSLTAGKFTENQYSNQIKSDGNQLDNAYVWGVSYKPTEQLSTAYYGTDVEDKLVRHYANVNYTHALQNDAALNLDFSGYHTEFEAGADTASHTTNDLSDRQNSIFAVSVGYNKDVHGVMLAYQQNSGNTGYDYGYNADGAQSIYLPNSYLADFIGNDEKSLQLQYNLNFKHFGLPGLNWTTAFVYGWDIKVADDIDRSKIVDTAEEHEFFNQVKYTVQSGALKDASLRLRHSYLRASDSYQGNNGIGDTNEWRIWLDIPVTLF